MGVLTASFPTLLDVARRRAPGGGVDIVAEILQQYNDILDDIPWIEGNLPTGHQTTLRTSKPGMSFRLLNQGVVPVKTTTGQIVDSCAIIEKRSHIDIEELAIAIDKQAFRMSEDKGIIESCMDDLSQTLVYGDVTVNPERFNGLASRYYAVADSSTTSTTKANVFDAGGTGSDNTSVWLVCWSTDKVFGIYPKGSIGGLDHKDLGEITVVDPNNSSAFMEVMASKYTWKCGLCIRDWRYVVRICNIDVSNLATAGDGTDTSANLLKFMSRAIDQLPPKGGGYRPVFYMNNKTLAMLRVKMQDKSNVHLQLEQLMSESIPRHEKTLTYMGVPCRRIDSILNTESRIT